MLAVHSETDFVIPTIPKELFQYSALQEAWAQMVRTHKSKFRNKQKGQLIFGKSGAGKSTLAEVYEACFPHVDRAEATVIPVLRVKLRENTFVPVNLMEQIIEAIGARPINDRTGHKIRYQLRCLLKEHGVELLILDEAQQSLPEKQGIQGLRMVKFFKEILEEFEMPIVFFGTPKSLRIQEFGQDKDIPIDEEQLSRDMFPPIELTAIKPRTTKWLECVNFFLDENNLPTLGENDADLVRRLYLAQQHKTFSNLATLFEEHDFSTVRCKSELLDHLQKSYQENLAHFGANPFDTTIYDESSVEQKVTDMRKKMDGELCD